jgi:ADP-L-glycero-D-manno-heptose 6-epimerase
MIVITGAAGFIGSCVARHFSSLVETEIVLVDDFSVEKKSKNQANLGDLLRVERNQFFNWVKDKRIDSIIHLGARTDTTEADYSIFEELNLEYSKQIWNLCRERNIPLIYASSAATYGDGAYGYNDDHNVVGNLEPLNAYGISKNEFDKWVLERTDEVTWYGLKFFNVYGPNEYHKGRMASVVFHAFNQIQENGSLKLFRSHNENYKDGEQLRDFIYVKDLCRVIFFLSKHLPESGLYNLGTGKARTFLDLAHATFEALGKESKISFIDTPADIRDNYQYYTEANMKKLKDAGYIEPFTSLEQGVRDYVQNYLLKESSF